MDFSRLQATSKIGEDFVYPQPPLLNFGWLEVDVDPAHRIYWEEYGNPAGEPVMFLHGGPGGACAPVMARFFDPKRYRVILFDQRGCGKSEPNVASAGPAVALSKNTTADLIGDIEKLREELEIGGPMHVFGGSWGSTLAMAYAIAHPAHCASLVLRGIFLGASEDLRAGYLVADRGETRILRDPFSNKPFVHFYATKRVGGAIIDSQAIKLMKFAAS